MWSGTLSNYSNLRIFCCSAFAHVKQDKLEPRALKCIFLGYPKGVKGYKLWFIDERKCIISRDVTFNENVMPLKHVNHHTPEPMISDTGDQFEVEIANYDPTIDDISQNVVRFDTKQERTS